MGMSYATAEQYATYTGTSAPSNIALLLTRATRAVDQALLTARYHVDNDGQPTDDAVATALQEATIEQAAYWAAGGLDDGSGAVQQYGNVSIGSVALGRAQTGAGGVGSGAARLDAPQARAVLQQAGLLGQSPLHADLGPCLIDRCCDGNP